MGAASQVTDEELEGCVGLRSETLAPDTEGLWGNRQLSGEGGQLLFTSPTLFGIYSFEGNRTLALVFLAASEFL